MGDLGVIEHDGIVAAVSPNQEADVRAALNAPDETPVSEPEVRATPTPAEPPAVEGDATSEPEPAKKGKPRHDPTARMLEATRKAKEEREAREALEREVADLRARVQAPRAELPAVVTPPKTAPVAEKFSFPDFATYLGEHPEATWDDWNDAKALALYDWRDARTQQTRASEREQSEVATLRAAHDFRVAESVKTKYPDFPQAVQRADAVLQAAGIQSWPPALERAIIGSDKSDDVFHHLATHPEVAVQWIRDSAELPVAAAGLIRRSLELLVGSAAAVSTGSAPLPRQSRAAPPPNPVGSTPLAASGSPDVLDPDVEIEKYRKAQQAKRRR